MRVILTHVWPTPSHTSVSSMDQTYTRVLTAYYSVALGAEIAGIYCLYYVLVAYFNNSPRFTVALDAAEQPEDNQQDFVQQDFFQQDFFQQDLDFQQDFFQQDLDFQPEHFADN